MDPSSFVEGQEIRIQIKTVLDPWTNAEHKTALKYPENFDRTAAGTLQVKVFTWESGKAAACDQYSASATALYTTSTFGISRIERLIGDQWVGSGHVTFPAPHHTMKFVVCFQHVVDATKFKSDVVNKWKIFSVNDQGLGQYVFQASAGHMYYYLPEPTAGQYAIVQLLSKEMWNFTYAPSTCGSATWTQSSANNCGWGDNLKIVAAGASCTMESQTPTTPYLGSSWVREDGRWFSQGLDGLRAQSTAGGAGKFGTQYANPLVDSWSDSGTYYPVNAERMIYTQTTTTTSSVLAQQAYILSYPHHAYVYVRLPQNVGSDFEVCFSSREQRLNWVTQNSTLDQVPLWRKLYRCSSSSSCSATTEVSGGRKFTVGLETVGWSMFDLTPNTWGTIVFDDKLGKLSNEASTSNMLTVGSPTATSAYPVAPGPTTTTNNANYWAPPGGDYFRIVKSSKFGENTGTSNGLSVGSFPDVGCWDRSLDVALTGSTASTSTRAPQHGGWVSDGAEYPIGSRDLTGDPTIFSPTNDAASQTATYSTLWVPWAQSQWYVCYRRTCGSAASCVQNSGMRVLPWHDNGTALNSAILSVTPVKFLHLESMYTPAYGMGSAASKLVPWTYGDTDLMYPPEVKWYMNDTRQATWGPIVIEKTNYSDTVKLDSRPWNGRRHWVNAGCMAAQRNYAFGFKKCSPAAQTLLCDQQQCTQGSALRLVMSNKPCDYPAFTGAVTMGANVTDGGAVECNSKDATTDGTYCTGRRADQSSISTVAFYITVPNIYSSGYRVCFQLGSWNWREVWPQSTGYKTWGDSTQASGARQRGDWVIPNPFTTAASNVGGGIDNWFLVTADASTELSLTTDESRAGMEALFVVKDSANPELSVAPRLPCAGGCDASGDVLRLVPSASTCDVYPNTVDGNGWTQALADDHLSLYCAQTGRGSASLSNTGLRQQSTNTAAQQPCAYQANTGNLFCKGFSCLSSLAASTTFASQAGDTANLANHLIHLPDVYDDIVPGDVVYYNFNSVAGAIEVPTYSSTAAQNIYKVCYKQMGTANWVIFTSTWTVTPSPGYLVKAVYASGATDLSSRDLVSGVDLMGGELQKFEVTFPNDVAVSLTKSVAPSGLSEGFFAKLVKDVGDENGCLNPAGGTEATPYVSQTEWVQVGTTLQQAEFFLVVPQEPGQYMLCMSARNATGTPEQLSWWRGRRASGQAQMITVHDNGVRYYVTEGNQPTNQGLTVVNLMRCKPATPPSGAAPWLPLGFAWPCDAAENDAVFNTNPNQDQAKIVSAGSQCKESAAVDGRMTSGTSNHVGIGHLVSGAQGSATNLGPGEGLTDNAELTVTLPAVTSDLETEYKVCVLTSFAAPTSGVWSGSRTAWVEVTQAVDLPGQLTLRSVITGRRAFTTSKSLLDKWSLDAALTPKKNLYTSAVVTDAVDGAKSVALAGSGSSFIKELNKENTIDGTDGFKGQEGFRIYSTEALTSPEQSYFSPSNLFKLVRIGGPKTRVPESTAAESTWGDVTGWATDPQASCNSPGYPSANNIDPCSAPEGSVHGAAQCPAVRVLSGSTTQVTPYFTVPLEPGKYIVCFKFKGSTVTTKQPWLLVRSEKAKDTSTQPGFFYSHPSFLEFESATPVTAGGVTTTTNLTVHDVRVAYDSTAQDTVPLSGWCSQVPFVDGAGSPCQIENEATPTETTKKFFYDLVTVVNSSQVCPVPQLGPNGMGTSGVHTWWQMWRTRNSSAMVANALIGLAAGPAATTFRLPPTKPSPSGQYKVCVFKAGEANYGAYATDYVSKKGVVYQVYNRGTASSGGGSGEWVDSVTGAPAKLLVEPVLAYNNSIRFIEYQGAATSALYNSAMVAAVHVTAPTGTVSRTPLLRSGSEVEFIVSVASSSGQLVPSGTYPIEVNRCSRPTSWAALECPLTTSTGPTDTTHAFDVENVGGSCPSTSTSALTYGWPSNGLRQFLDGAGVARFSLQYKSACDGGVWGCGVKFRASPSAGSVISSYPQWINVETKNYADAIGVGASVTTLTDVQPHVSPAGAKCEQLGTCSCSLPQCYLMQCTHNVPCSLSVGARFQGPHEYAPAGNVKVGFSALDYGAGLTNSMEAPSELKAVINGVTSMAEIPWARGGSVSYTFTPSLAQGSSTIQYAYLNASWQANAQNNNGHLTWTRVVVQVSRAEPASLAATDVRPLDIESPKLRALERELAPRFPLVAIAGLGLMGQNDGAFLEALVPYEVRYSITTSAGAAIVPAVGLSGWTVEAAFNVANTQNKILEVISGDQGLTEANLETLPASTATAFGGTTASSVPQSDLMGWYLRFRVLNNVGCSRFTGSLATGGFGCKIDFKFKKGSTAGPQMSLTAPVRVVGTTVSVSVMTNDVSMTPTTSAAVWDGLMVRAIPGTPSASGFLNDEYHAGDLFALWMEPHSTDGVSTRDGAWFTNTNTRCLVAGATTGSCMVPRYAPTAITVGVGSSQWGAQWVVTTNVPCYNCELSFHSLGGAGPNSYEVPALGYAKVSLTQPDAKIVCNTLAQAELTVSWVNGEKASESFAVLVAAVKGSDLTVSAVWPRWYVTLNTSTDVTFPAGYSLSGASGVRSQQMGTAASTSFTMLSIAGAAAPAASVTGTLAFRTNAPQYDATTVGSVPSTSKALSCTVKVTMNPVDPTPAPTTVPTKLVNITKVDRATMACKDALGCGEWYTTTTSMQEVQGGIRANVRFFLNTGAVDTATQRNVTVIAATEAAQDPATLSAAVTFVKDATSGVDQAVLATGTTVPSYWELAAGTNNKTIDAAGTQSRVFTFGKIALKFQRSQVSAAAEASVVLMYDAAQTSGNNFPVRDARVALCGSTLSTSNVENLEINTGGGKVCTVLRLWVRPETSSPKVFLWTQPLTAQATANAGLPADATGAPQCAPAAGTQLIFQSISYYEMLSVAGASTLAFIVYDQEVKYTFSLGSGATAQTLVPATYLTLTNKSLTNAATSPAATYDAGQRVTHGDSFDSMKCAFGVYGLDVIATSQAASVSAVSASDSTLSFSTTTSFVQFKFEKAAESYNNFKILDSVTYDDECPSKRRMTAQSPMGNFYRYYNTAAAPALGWGHSPQTVSVGQPFPLQTMVEIAGAGRGTGLDKRAFTFASDNTATPGKSLLSISKVGWGGCGDGGALTTQQLKASSASEMWKLLPGTTTSFDSAGAVRTNQGVGSSWLAFSEPCTKCTVQVDLCYMGATGASDCLTTPNEALASDTAPIYSQRRKVSKEIQVLNMPANRLEITSQTTPGHYGGPATGATQAMAAVGQGFSVTLEAVRTFNTWTFAAGNTAATFGVDTVWNCGTGCVGLNGRYGNGGWLMATASEADLAARLGFEAAPKCTSVSETELVGARMHPFPSIFGLSVAAGGTTVGFYFTRPCSACLVVIGVKAIGGAASTDLIYLHQYAPSFTTLLGAAVWVATPTPTTWKVSTCGTRWAWAGREPTPSVRKNKAWSVAVWRADSNRFPSFDGTNTASLNMAGSPWDFGNGDGGEWMFSQPSSSAVEGSAFFRVTNSRACYRCSATVGGSGSQLKLEMAVLTDATQIAFLPAADGSTGQFVAKNDTTNPAEIGVNKASIKFEAWAADEVGDRSYTVAGPTLQSYQPRWSWHSRTAGKLDVDQFGTTDTLLGVSVSTSTPSVVTAKDANDVDVITAVTDGRPRDMAVTNGSVVYNGIPFAGLTTTQPTGSMDIGEAVVELTGTGSFVPINLRMSPGATTVPTRLFGEKEAVQVGFTVKPTHMALENAAALSCANGLEGGACTVSAYAVGHRPGSEKTVFQLSTLAVEKDAKATASATCNNDAAPGATTLCAISVESSAAFVSGVAKFGVKFVSASSDASVDTCSCTVTVTGPSGLLTNSQKVVLSFKKKTTWTPTKFIWAGSTTLNQPATSGQVTTVIFRPVTLTLQAVNDARETGTGNVVWDAKAATSVTLAVASMTPSGCFLQSSATVSINGLTVSVTGYFNSSSCTIQKGALLNPPLPLNDDLVASAKTPSTLKSVPVQTSWGGAGRARGMTAVTHSWSGLTVKTAGGNPAALSHVGTKLSVQVMDSEGNVAVGDFHTTVLLKFTVGKNAMTVGAMQVMGGATSFHIFPPNYASTWNGTHHVPWQFHIEGSSELAPTGSFAPTVVNKVDPLYFVTEKRQLFVLANFDSFFEKEGGQTGEFLLPNKRAVAQIDQGMKVMKQMQSASSQGAAMMLQNANLESIALAAIYSNSTKLFDAPPQWIPGYPFTLVIMAADVTGQVYTSADNVGAKAEVLLRAVGIPCMDSEGGMRVQKTCIQGVSCSALSFAALPACGAAGWTEQGVAMKPAMGISSIGGRDILPLQAVRYNGVRQGVVQFAVTVVRGWSHNPDYVFIGEIDMRRIARLCILEGGKCLPCVPHPDPAMANTVDLCHPPSETKDLERVDKLSLDLAFVDIAGDTVKAESMSSVIVTGYCAESLTFVGTGEDFVSAPTFKAEKGVFNVDDLQFDGACGNFSLTFKAVPSPSVEDTFSQVANLKMITTKPFHVKPIKSDTPSPPITSVPPPPVEVQFKLKQFAAAPVAQSRASLNSFAGGIDGNQFSSAFCSVAQKNSRYIAGCVLQAVCGIPAGATVSENCTKGGSSTNDPTSPDYGCACIGFNGNPNTGVGHRAVGLQTAEVTLDAKAKVDLNLAANAGSEFNDNPAAVAALSDTVAKGVAADLEQGKDSILKSSGGAGFAEAKGSDLGWTSKTKATPAPPEGANTPKPTNSPSKSPTATPTSFPSKATPSPSKTPPTSFPSASTSTPSTATAPSSGGRATLSVLLLVLPMLFVNMF